MKQLQATVAVALLVVLTLIAWELDQVRRELAPSGALSTAAIQFLTPHAETREQRNQRLQRLTQETIEDSRAILATPDPAKPTARK